MKWLTRHRAMIVFRVFSVVALVFAAALAVDYYFSDNTFCHQGGQCEIVAKSEFGRKIGIYFPILGLTTYSFFIIASFFARKRLLPWLGAAAIVSALGAVSFILIQAFYIDAFCWMCMGVDSSAILASIPAAAFILYRKKFAEEEKPFCGYELNFWLTLAVAAVALPMVWGIYKPQVPNVLPGHGITATGNENVPESLKKHYVDGKVNIVELSSFMCGHCRALHPEFQKLLDSYASQIHFMRIPISFDGKPNCTIAYLCAEQQQKETAFADMMFEAPNSEARTLAMAAEKVGIDMQAFNTCLAAAPIMAKAKSLLADVEVSGFEGAPTIWIDQQKIVGFRESKGMTPYKAAIERALHKDQPMRTDNAVIKADTSMQSQYNWPFIWLLIFFMIDGMITIKLWINHKMKQRITK